MDVLPGLEKFETTRTTVSLPTRLVERTQMFIDRGLLPNRSAAIAAALESFLDEIERQEIDHAFETLGSDADFARVSEELDDAFAESDWQALLTAESERP